MKTKMLRVGLVLLMPLLPTVLSAQVNLKDAPVEVDTTAVDDDGMETEAIDTAICAVDDTDTCLAESGQADGNGQLDNVSFTVDVPEKWSMSYSDSLAYSYFFPQAIAMMKRGKQDAAFDLLELCRRLNPRAPEVYYYLSGFYAYLDNDSVMQQAMKAAVNLAPNNQYMLTGLLNAYNMESNYEEATKVAEDILTKTDDKLPVLQNLINLYYVTRQKEKVLKTIDKIELLGGGSDELTFARAQLLEEMGRHKQAQKVYDNLIKENPNDESFRLKLGNFFVNQKKYPEAKRVFDTVMGDDPESPEGQLSMLGYYRAVGDSVSENNERMKLLLNKRTSVGTRQAILRMELAIALTDSSKLAPVGQLIDTLLARDPANTQFLLAKGQLLATDSTKIGQAKEYFSKVVELEPGNQQALQYLIAATFPGATLSEAQRDSTWQEIMRLARQGAQYNPTEKWFYDVWAQGGYELKQPQTTVNACRAAINHRTKSWDDSEVSDLYGMMGDALHQLGKEQEAFAAFDSSLVWNENNYMVLNNYAYFLCLKGADLDRAAKMSLKAVNGDPNSANSIDTYAWVLFRQGRYDEARQFIDLALQVDTDTTGDNSTLLDHAGDIYFKCGLTDEAVDWWQRALKKKSGDALLERKIKEKKYYERKEE